MAKKALVAKAKRKPKFEVRGYTRCQRCGRPRAVYRRFGLCRICFREMAHRGELPGITKVQLVDRSHCRDLVELSLARQACGHRRATDHAAGPARETTARRATRP